jgi:hypothetical protein
MAEGDRSAHRREWDRKLARDTVVDVNVRTGRSD